MKVSLTQHIKGMKITLLALCFGLFLLSGFVSKTHAFSSEESITELDVVIEIQPDRSIVVQETILYDFADNQKRGIIRSIPEERIPGSLKSLNIEDIQVFDQNQNSHPFEIIQGGNFVDIKIGDPNVYISGEHVYVIQYRVEHAIGIFGDFDELYWNAIGHDWEVPIYTARASILIPTNLGANDITPQVFCGYRMDKEVCADSSIQNTFRGTEIVFETYPGYTLGEFKGMTTVVSFPKYIVRDFSVGEKFIIHTVPVLKFVIPLFAVWYLQRKNITRFLKRRSYFRNNPVITEYESGDLDTLTASIILHGTVTDTALVGHVFSLVTQGYLELNKKDDGLYEFKKTHKSIENLPEHSKGIVEQITTKGYDTNKNQNWLSSFVLSGVIKPELQSKNLLEDHKRGFSGQIAHPGQTPMMKRGLWWLYLFLAVNPGIFIWFLAGRNIGFMFSGTMVLLAVFTLLHAVTRPHLRPEAFEIERKILGIKKYILVAEKEKILFHSDPANNLLFFEKLLPFAILFKLEKKWVQEFEKLGIAQPAWIPDGDFNSHTFLTSVIAAQSSLQHTIDTYQPTISSSGGGSSSFSSSSSGSSSGSSGGGGGGGGGSSW